MQRKTQEQCERLARLIESGQVGANGFLPPERQLCQQLGIGRLALRSIYKELCSRKYLRLVPDKGIRITYRKEGQSSLRKYLLVMEKATQMHEKELVDRLCGLVSAAGSVNAELVIAFLHDLDDGNTLQARLEDGNYDGVIFSEVFTPQLQAAVQKSGLPYLVANMENDLHAPAVRIDLQATGRMAGQLLLKTRRRIGFLGKKTHFYTELFTGMADALAEKKIAPEPELCFFTKEYSRTSEEPLYAELEKWLRKSNARKNPIALFAGRDYWARILYHICAKLRLRIPEEVAVLGYDNLSWPGAETAGLSTLAQPAFETGECALLALHQAVEKGEPVQSKLLTPSPCLRKSLP